MTVLVTSSIFAHSVHRNSFHRSGCTLCLLVNHVLTDVLRNTTAVIHTDGKTHITPSFGCFPFPKPENNSWTGFKYTAQPLYLISAPSDHLFTRHFHNSSLIQLPERPPIFTTAIFCWLITTTKSKQALLHRSLSQIASSFSIQSQLY